MNFRKICCEGDSDKNYSRWLTNLKGKSGVYVIRCCGFWDGAEVVYVGESHTGRLATTIKRHFTPWPDTEGRKHFVYDRNKVTVAVKITPAGKALAAQNRLIVKLKPRDNVFIPNAPDEDEPF